MDDVSESTIAAFLTLMLLVWLFVAVGVQLAGLVPQLPKPARSIMDPTGTVDARAAGN